MKDLSSPPGIEPVSPAVRASSQPLDFRERLSLWSFKADLFLGEINALRVNSSGASRCCLCSQGRGLTETLGGSPVLGQAERQAVLGRREPALELDVLGESPAWPLSRGQRG